MATPAPRSQRCRAPSSRCSAGAPPDVLRARYAARAPAAERAGSTSTATAPSAQEDEPDERGRSARDEGPVVPGPDAEVGTPVADLAGAGGRHRGEVDVAGLAAGIVEVTQPAALERQRLRRDHADHARPGDRRPSGSPRTCRRRGGGAGAGSGGPRRAGRATNRIAASTAASPRAADPAPGRHNAHRSPSFARSTSARRDYSIHSQARSSPLSPPILPRQGVQRARRRWQPDGTLGDIDFYGRTAAFPSTAARCYAIPLRTRFRGITVREGVLVEGAGRVGRVQPVPGVRRRRGRRAWLRGRRGGRRRGLAGAGARRGAGQRDRAGRRPRAGARRRRPVAAAAPPRSRWPSPARPLGRRPGPGRGGPRRAGPGRRGARRRQRGLGRRHGGRGRIRALDRAAGGLEYVEQPCATVEDLAAVRRRVGRADRRRRVDPPGRRPATGWPSPAPPTSRCSRCSRWAGCAACLRIAEDDRAAGAWCRRALETSVGIAAGVALAAALPELDLRLRAGHACRCSTGDVVRARRCCPGRRPAPRRPALPRRRIPPCSTRTAARSRAGPVVARPAGPHRQDSRRAGSLTRMHNAPWPERGPAGVLRRRLLRRRRRRPGTPRMGRPRSPSTRTAPGADHGVQPRRPARHQRRRRRRWAGRGGRAPGRRVAQERLVVSFGVNDTTPTAVGPGSLPSAAPRTCAACWPRPSAAGLPALVVGPPPVADGAAEPAHRGARRAARRDRRRARTRTCRCSRPCGETTGGWTRSRPATAHTRRRAGTGCSPTSWRRCGCSGCWSERHVAARRCHSPRRADHGCVRLSHLSKQVYRCSRSASAWTVCDGGQARRPPPSRPPRRSPSGPPSTPPSPPCCPLSLLLPALLAGHPAEDAAEQVADPARLPARG